MRPRGPPRERALVARSSGDGTAHVLAPYPELRAVRRAFAPSIETVARQRAAMADAVAAGQLGPEADSDEAIYLTRRSSLGCSAWPWRTSPTSNGDRVDSPPHSETHEAARGCLSDPP
jgi:hypothetical protein